MTAAPGSYTVEEVVSIAAAPDAVWQALVDHDARQHWWPHLRLNASTGGGFEERWTHPDGRSVLTHGQLMAVIPNRLLRMSWADEDWDDPTEVEIRLEANAGATAVRVIHSGWERLAGGMQLAQEHRAGWRTHLANLQAYVENPS